jgi:hypothetical protein
MVTDATTWWLMQQLLFKTSATSWCLELQLVAKVSYILIALCLLPGCE